MMVKVTEIDGKRCLIEKAESHVIIFLFLLWLRFFLLLLSRGSSSSSRCCTSGSRSGSGS